MINKSIKYLTLLFLVIIISSCTEKVDLKLDKTYERLVVDGFVSSKPGPQTIILTKTSDYFYNAPSPKVVNASVKVTDGTSEWTLSETVPGSSGIYQTPDNFTGEISKTYTLKIDLQDEISGEKSFESSCKLNRVTTLDSIKTVFEPDWGPKGFWLVKIFAKDPGDEENYYMLHLYKNGKLWSDSITKVSVSDDKYFNGNYLNGADVWLINEEDTWLTLHEGDSLGVELSAISKEYYNFVVQVQQAGFNIPFFSGPPANVEGNINNNGVGFFYAYSSSFANCVVKK